MFLQTELADFERRVIEAQAKVALQKTVVSAATGDAFRTAFAVRHLKMLEESLAVLERAHDNLLELARRRDEREIKTAQPPSGAPVRATI